MVYRSLLLLISASVIGLASPDCICAEIQGAKIRSRGDVQRLILQGSKQESDWTIAYEVMQEYLSTFPKYEIPRLDEYELLGLSREEVQSVLGKYLGCDPYVDRDGVDVFAFGCGQGGLSFKVKYDKNKAESVSRSFWGGHSSTAGPWISSRIEGWRKAELDVSSWLRTYRLEKIHDFSWCESMRSIYRRRALLKHYLSDDEGATRDLVAAAGLPILADDGKNPSLTSSKQVESAPRVRFR